MDTSTENVENVRKMLEEKITEMNDVFQSVNHLANINFEVFDVRDVAIFPLLMNAVDEVKDYFKSNPIEIICGDKRTLA